MQYQEFRDPEERNAYSRYVQHIERRDVRDSSNTWTFWDAKVDPSMLVPQDFKGPTIRVHGGKVRAEEYFNHFKQHLEQLKSENPAKYGGLSLVQKEKPTSPDKLLQKVKTSRLTVSGHRKSISKTSSSRVSKVDQKQLDHLQKKTGLYG